MKWFGESWGAPVCEPRLHAETPTDATCEHCRGPINPGDMGFLLPLASDFDGLFIELAYHRFCLLATIIPDFRRDDLPS